VLLQCLKRVDLLLFAHLLGGGDAPGVPALMAEYDPHAALAAGPGGGIPQLDEASLPFARGGLTFGGGARWGCTRARGGEEGRLRVQRCGCGSGCVRGCTSRPAQAPA
jgi:hypothetical protein